MKRPVHCVEQQLHQIFLPATKRLMIDPCHTSNVIHIAPSNRPHPPTSPSIAPATTYDIPKNEKTSAENGWSVIHNGGRFEHDPTMVRPWSEPELVIWHPRSPRLLFALWRHILYGVLLHALAIYPKFTTCCPCHEKWLLTLQHHQILHLPRKVTLQHHKIDCAYHHQHHRLRLPRKVTLWATLLRVSTEVTPI